jgi:hypothetical protein
VKGHFRRSQIVRNYNTNTIMTNPGLFFFHNYYCFIDARKDIAVSRTPINVTFQNGGSLCIVGCAQSCDLSNAVAADNNPHRHNEKD